MVNTPATKLAVTHNNPAPFRIEAVLGSLDIKNSHNPTNPTEAKEDNTIIGCKIHLEEQKQHLDSNANCLDTSTVCGI